MGSGQDYRGSRDFSREGVTCQAWSSQYPHPHSELTGTPEVDEENGTGNHNFCRNPGGRRARPWCFVLLEKVEWQYCDIKICWRLSLVITYSFYYWKWRNQQLISTGPSKRYDSRRNWTISFTKYKATFTAKKQWTWIVVGAVVKALCCYVT